MWSGALADSVGMKQLDGSIVALAGLSNQQAAANLFIAGRVSLERALTADLIEQYVRCSSPPRTGLRGARQARAVRRGGGHLSVRDAVYPRASRANIQLPALTLSAPAQGTVEPLRRLGHEVRAWEKVPAVIHDLPLVRGDEPSKRKNGFRHSSYGRTLSYLLLRSHFGHPEAGHIQDARSGEDRHPDGAERRRRGL